MNSAHFKKLSIVAVLILSCNEREEGFPKIAWYCAECCNEFGSEIVHQDLSKWECQENNERKVNDHTWTWSWKEIEECGLTPCKIDPPEDLS